MGGKEAMEWNSAQEFAFVGGSYSAAVRYRIDDLEWSDFIRHFWTDDRIASADSSWG